MREGDSHRRRGSVGVSRRQPVVSGVSHRPSPWVPNAGPPLHGVELVKGSVIRGGLGWLDGGQDRGGLERGVIVEANRVSDSRGLHAAASTCGHRNSEEAAEVWRLFAFQESRTMEAVDKRRQGAEISVLDMWRLGRFVTRNTSGHMPSARWSWRFVEDHPPPVGVMS